MHDTADRTDVHVLMLLTDAYGGYGGIAQYNRDFIEALCALPEIGRVQAVPRVAQPPLGDIPAKLDFPLSGVGSIARFTRAALSKGLFGPKPDIVICGHINLLPWCAVIARLRGAKLVLLMFGIDTWQPTGRTMIDRLAGKVDLVISISRITLDRYLQWAPAPRQGTALLPNAIHLEEYGLGPKAPDLIAQYGLAGRKVLMTFGRIAASEQAKGFDEMIEILPRLLRRDPSIVYLVAGKGDDVDRLKAKAAALGVADHVVFTGMIAEDRKADHYRLADVFVLPSKGEGFGFVILEALACGIPAIASRIDGGYEAVRNGMLGQAVDPANADELEAAILTALEAPREIPAGLDYFAFPEFVERLHSILFGKQSEATG